MVAEIIHKSKVEVELPLFFKSETGIWYGILSEDQGVCVNDSYLWSTTMPQIYLQFYKEENKVSAKKFAEVLEKEIETFNTLKLTLKNN
jgi:hypothetical protein